MRLENLWVHRIWDLVLVGTVTFDAVELPTRMVLDYPLYASLQTLDQVIPLILCLDIVMRWWRPASLTGQAGTPLSRPRLLTQWLWFLVDLIATVPYGVLLTRSLWLLLPLVKLARIAQVMRHWRHHEMQNANLLRLAFFVYWLLLTSHWLACGWLALGGIAAQDAAPSDMPSQYIRALYWCITTLATVGYGDVIPKTNAQTVYAMVVMLLGVGVYGYVIGNVTSLLANIDLAKSHYLETMERLGAFMRYRNIPPVLQRRLRDYYAYLWANRMGYDEANVLAELPDSLRTEVALFLRRDFIEHAPLFRGASHELVREIALELRPVVFTPGDYLVRAGEYGRHMYFLSRGTVEIIAPDGKTLINTLRDGDFFGEVALLFSQPRTASVRAVDYCDLYTLDKATFDRILARHPSFASQIREEATRRRQDTEHVAQHPDASTDLEHTC